MTYNYLNDLNEAQKQAVINYEGPSLVIAGAGAGKTRVLTYRIVHLLHNAIPPHRILALTFTNKAAREMKGRIAGILDPVTARYLWMGTFHSIFAKILRTEGDKLGYKPNYTIYDSSDSRSLIRAIIKELNLDDNTYKPGVVASRISAAKNNLVTASIYSSDAATYEYDKSSRMPLLAEIYRSYAARCYKANAMDFDDLLLNTNILFRDFPDVLEKYQQKFSYILVDEYQDTNYAQYLIIKKLASAHRNICVVGDDAQSIYSFRGARIENILEFRNDYTDCRLYKLEQNYRSTKTIVNAANKIIENNEDQIKKTVFSKNEEGDKIQLMQAMTDTEEGFLISSDIFDRKYSNQLRWSDFAILYRTNAQSRIFEETLRRKNIPYKIYGGLSFYERKEIKDILAYFRIIINHDDEEAIRRIINYPKRGIGDTTLQRIFELASANNLSPWAIIKDVSRYSAYFNTGTVKKLSDFAGLIETMTVDIQVVDAYNKAREIAVSSGIMKELKEGHSPEEVSRYENLEEMLNGIKVFTESAETNGESSVLEAYMANVALLTDQDNEKEEDRDKVTLMTMHSAKGLEFKNVYIAGMEDTLFPSPMSAGNPRELEEERRLFYVALTRAEKLATLSYALNRYKWGNLERSNPSRFLKEIDNIFLSYPQTGGKPFIPKQTNEKAASLLREENHYRIPSDRLRKITSASKAEDLSCGPCDPSEFSEGDKVEHNRFGKGYITRIDGKPPNTTATVDFKNEGTRKLLLRFARLKKI